jgi:glutamate synthase domain-containing protein 1
MQMPHDFMKKVGAEASIKLPDEKEYGCGLVFLPPDATLRKVCMDRFEKVIREEGQEFIGWRRVPVNSESLGELARQLEPAIYQIFIGRGAGVDNDALFERKLYVIRKVIERFARVKSAAGAIFSYAQPIQPDPGVQGHVAGRSNRAILSRSG